MKVYRSNSDQVTMLAWLASQKLEAVEAAATNMGCRTVADLAALDEDSIGSLIISAGLRKPDAIRLRRYLDNLSRPRWQPAPGAAGLAANLLTTPLVPAETRRPNQKRGCCRLTESCVVRRRSVLRSACGSQLPRGPRRARCLPYTPARPARRGRYLTHSPRSGWGSIFQQQRADAAPGPISGWRLKLERR